MNQSYVIEMDVMVEDQHKQSKLRQDEVAANFVEGGTAGNQVTCKFSKEVSTMLSSRHLPSIESIVKEIRTCLNAK
jgi:hypothetical protein